MIRTRKGYVTLVCTKKGFRPVPTDSTRWWDVSDWREYFRATDGALGWGNPPHPRKDWVKYYGQGNRFCATLKRGRAVAVAGLWPRTKTEWLVIANGLKLRCEGKGYAEEILSFVVDESLKTGRNASFMVRSNDPVWLPAAQAVGFRKRRELLSNGLSPPPSAFSGWCLTHIGKEGSAIVMTARRDNLETVRSAWDAYHAEYMDFHLKEWPDFHEHFAQGGTILDAEVAGALGDLTGLSLLDVCCACDAKQAFSWANLGARVTACDLSPAAIRIAKDNADRIGIPVEFHVADAQTLEPIPDAAFDVVFATYLSWYEDLPLACSNWHRVLRPGGRMLMHFHHPFTWYLEERNDSLLPERDYFDTEPHRGDFTGTPLADRHGGWGRRMPCVEFHHTLSDIVEAGLSAGFRLLKMTEHCHVDNGPLSKLPSHALIVWQKEQ
ncbi:class I SAM-dependent methyltransferase [Verrucomicrobiota bacterium]